MTTFGELYRDVISNLNVPEDQLRFKDVSNAINQAISEIRTEYVKSGLGYEFAVTERIAGTSRDIQYPFLQKAPLSYPIIRTLPISMAVKSSVFQVSDNILENRSQAWATAGTTVIRDDDIYAYKSTEAIPTLTNTYNLTFDPIDVKNFYTNNGLKFAVGDVVYDQASGSYYRCDTAYTNNTGATIEDSGAFTKVYWKKIGNAYFQGMVVPFNALHETRINQNINRTYPFTILEDTVYTSVSGVTFTITYIPEWTYLESMTAQLTIPDTMITTVKGRSIELLSVKLGLQQPRSNEGE